MAFPSHSANQFGGLCALRIVQSISATWYLFIPSLTSTGDAGQAPEASAYPLPSPPEIWLRGCETFGRAATVATSATCVATVADVAGAGGVALFRSDRTAGEPSTSTSAATALAAGMAGSILAANPRLWS